MTMPNHRPLHPRDVIAQRTFTAEDQTWFARVSGDTNPMHMDALTARRTQAGAPVVHGIHALLWILESLAAAGANLLAVNQIRVEFLKFIFLGQPLKAEIKQVDATFTRIRVIGGDINLMTAQLRIGARPSAAAPSQRTLVPASAEADVLSFDQMAGLSGWLSPPGGPTPFAEAFPHASAVLDPRRLSALAQTSRLVGMVCPGLHSMYSELLVDITASTGAREGIAFDVNDVNDRYRRIALAITGSGVAGKVTAFVRNSPVEARAIADIAVRVEPDEFASTRALVVGGSRGLGAITAKVIAVGGGQVTLTYATGRADAEELRSEIVAAYGAEAVRILHLNAMQPVAPQLLSIKETFTHLCYFATPQIFVQKADVFSSTLYGTFSRIYVDAFYETCLAVMKDNLSVFYPSSVAVEERPKGMTEYSMAKAAGEILCTDMVRGLRGLRIATERLPRILTDQTATIAHIESKDALDTMLPIIRSMHAPA